MLCFLRCEEANMHSANAELHLFSMLEAGGVRLLINQHLSIAVWLQSL